MIRTSHFFLACASKFLRLLFISSSDSYDLICSEFEPAAVEKVLDLVSGKVTHIDHRDIDLYNQFCFVLNQLKIEIQLPPRLGASCRISAISRDIKPSPIKLGRLAMAVDLSDPMVLKSKRGQSFRASAVDVQQRSCILTKQEFSPPDDRMKFPFSPRDAFKDPIDEYHQPRLEKHRRRLVFGDESDRDRSILAITMLDIKDELHDSGFEQYLSSFCSPDPSHGATLQQNSSVLDAEEEVSEQSSSSVETDDDGDQTLETTDDNSMESDPDQGGFKCHICPQRTTNYQDMALHIGRSHLKKDLERFYHPTQKDVCRVCLMEFISEFELDNHAVHVHNAIGESVPLAEQLRVPRLVNDTVPAKLYADRKEKSNSGASNSGPSNEKVPQIQFKVAAEGGDENEGRGEGQQGQPSEPKKIKLEVETETEKIAPGAGMNAKKKWNKKRDKSGQTSLSDPKIGYYQCPECHVKALRLHNLKSHFAMVHRKQELLGFVGESGVDCILCRRIFSSTSALICHLAKSHDVLSGKFSASNESYGSGSNETLEISDDGSRTCATETAKVPLTTEKQVYRCPSCNEDFRMTNQLLGHMATKHFQAELLQSNLLESLGCQECTNLSQTKSKFKLAKHLAIQHQMLAHHLPRPVRETSRVADTSVPKRLDCFACGKVFQKTCGLLSHERSCKLRAQQLQSEMA